MAGTNPFRPKNIDNEAPGAPRQVHAENEGRIPTIDTDIRKTSKKTVRIVSPHSATSDNGTSIPDVLFSPPPHKRKPLERQWNTTDISEDSSSPDDPFGVDSDDGGLFAEDVNLRRNTLQNAGSSYKQALGRQKAPPNPFERRTAIMVSSTRTGDERATKSSAADPKTRPQYSVEEFKNLLLTGRTSTVETPATGASSALLHTVQAPGDTSSNTDSSSISRQSIFEPPPEARQDTPRTSQELYPSDDERQQSAHDLRSANPEKKPATLQSQYGKPMEEDISRAEIYSGPWLSISNSKISDAWTGKLSPGCPRTPTDLNKPLPLPPTVEAADHELPNPLRSFAMSKRDPQTDSPNLKKEPPAPPSARRQGQARPKSLFGESGQGMPEGMPVSQGKSSEALHSDPKHRDQPSEASSKPPPPPPRRPGISHGLSASSTTSGVSMVPTPSSSTFSDDSLTSKTKPPVPPTRNRSSSLIKRQTTLPTQISSTAMPPAPPPRRRGSSQSSFSPTRLSGEYQPSFTGRQRADSGASSIQSKNVMADLSALQKEVDALRGKFGT